MTLLLDTSVIIPLANNEIDRLPTTIRRELSGAHQFAASTASLWEIAIKHRQGKLALPVELRALPAYLNAFGIRLLDIRLDHVLADVDPLPATKDPFDRLLLAICDVEHMRLLTTDAKLASHPLAWRPGSA